MAEEWRNSPLLRSRRHSPTLGLLHFTLYPAGLSGSWRSGSLGFAFGLGGVSIFSYLRLCQAKQMGFEKVKGITWNTTGKVDLWYSLLRTFNYVSHTDIL